MRSMTDDQVLESARVRAAIAAVLLVGLLFLMVIAAAMGDPERDVHFCQKNPGKALDVDRTCD